MIDNIKWLGHSTIKIVSNNIIYIDPYRILENYHDADYVFITHSHYDHYSEKDLLKCINEKTKIIITNDLYDQLIKLGIKDEYIKTVLPNNNYEIDNIKFRTIPSYNTNKPFHPKENNWVGYIINYNEINYYIAGDTDITDEAKSVKCDIAFLPIGGVYTMDYKEAATLTNIIKPKVVIPIHYGTIVGTKMDAENFKKNINTDIECKIL